jgi:hypothetical protein
MNSEKETLSTRDSTALSDEALEQISGGDTATGQASGKRAHGVYQQPIATANGLPNGMSNGTMQSVRAVGELLENQ